MNGSQIKRKWLSLPLLLLFPIIIISLIAMILVSFFANTDQTPIQVGLVDLDQSEETTMLTELITEAPQLGSFLQIKYMSEDEAQQRISHNDLSAYIVFPKHFTSNLYKGNAVKLVIKGNPLQPTESYAIKELLDSLARHIRSAQANILTINDYARKLNIDDNTRHDMMFEQFKDFFLYSIGKDKIVNQNKIENIATSSPVNYFVISGWFILITIWTFIMNNVLYQVNSYPMQQRIALYGVKAFQQVIARIAVAFSVSLFLAIGSFLILEHILDFQLSLDNQIRVVFVMSLYLLLFLFVYTIIEALIRSKKLQLLLQLLFTGLLLISSGAMIPSIYFSIQVQEWIAHSFTFEAFYWLQEILLNGRYYADYLPLLIMNLICFLLLAGILSLKERVQR